MSTAFVQPGLFFEVIRRPAEPSPLRSDVAGFVAFTRRGLVGVPVRVQGWRGFQEVFGGLDTRYHSPYAIRGYFENNGEIAWIVRLPGPPTKAAETAAAEWETAGAKNLAAGYELVATSPGTWATGAEISIRYELASASSDPQLTLTVRASGEPVEWHARIPALDLVSEVNARSRYIRLKEINPPSAAPGPRLRNWTIAMGTLRAGSDPEPAAEQYREALMMLNEQPEVALIALPDLWSVEIQNLATGAEREILGYAISTAEALRDRMVIADAPLHAAQARDEMAWFAAEGREQWTSALRAGALYHPWVRVPDPQGGTLRPVRSVPPSGHVAGVISRLDRERGPHSTPANAILFDAIDITTSLNADQFPEDAREIVNPLLCRPGRGIEVWGGRTLAEPQGNFIAHRRLIHRLVRAIRRVAEPLVFEINGPELWLALARASTTVLLEAWRAGRLKGQRSEEAFRVRCDAANNPQANIDLGQVLCEIDVAPAAPMEFITLRIELGTDGLLEVFES